MELTKYKDYVRKGARLEFTSPAYAAERTGKMMNACADAYGYLAGIDATHLGLADDVFDMFLEEIEIFAKNNSIPIMQKDGIEFLVNYIREHKIK